MSDYVKSTNFASKDTLPSGNSNKIVKGTELDIEFTNISSAVSSKADSNSPALTGVPTATTAAVGTNTAQIATTAFVAGAFGALGNMSSQNKNAVDITGGTITGITDLAVADGGTGASSLTAKALLVGNGTGAVQTIAPGTAGQLLTSNGTDWVADTPAYVGGIKGQVFTSSGTFTVPSGVTAVKVSIVGGGGGGRGTSGGGATVGGGGGTSSFGSYCSATGGGGASNASTGSGQNGSASGCTYTTGPMLGGGPGTSVISGSPTSAGGPSGYGWAGGVATDGAGSGSLGGNGGAGVAYITGLVPGATIAVTVGGGGGSANQSGYNGTNGASGAVLIEW